MTPVVNPYRIDRLLPEDLPAYKAIRLEALALEPGKFGSSHAIEMAFTEPEWVDRLATQDKACFGLYCGGEIIGLTAISITNEESGEAYMTQSYIREAHRGKRLSRMLYEARLQWAREHELKKLVISHREGNIASRQANQHFGFKYTHRKPRNWPDGQTEDMLFYELLLA